MVNKIINFEILNESILSVTWSDNHSCYLILKDIRDACPCATCKAAQKGFKKKIKLQNNLSYQLVSVEEVGNYALKFKWEDGHETGIYSYESLLKLCNCEK
tara:strand:+ start:529 stop:831 length:303 start_codon:yes stop_codon:yes gene_type:complete